MEEHGSRIKKRILDIEKTENYDPAQDINAQLKVVRAQRKSAEEYAEKTTGTNADVYNKRADDFRRKEQELEQKSKLVESPDRPDRLEIFSEQEVSEDKQEILDRLKKIEKRKKALEGKKDPSAIEVIKQLEQQEKYLKEGLTDLDDAKMLNEARMEVHESFGAQQYREDQKENIKLAAKERKEIERKEQEAVTKEINVLKERIKETDKRNIEMKQREEERESKAEQRLENHELKREEMKDLTNAVQMLTSRIDSKMLRDQMKAFLDNPSIEAYNRLYEEVVGTITDSEEHRDDLPFYKKWLYKESNDVKNAREALEVLNEAMKKHDRIRNVKGIE